MGNGRNSFLFLDFQFSGNEEGEMLKLDKYLFTSENELLAKMLGLCCLTLQNNCNLSLWKWVDEERG